MLRRAEPGRVYSPCNIRRERRRVGTTCYHRSGESWREAYQVAGSNIMKTNGDVEATRRAHPMSPRLTREHMSMRVECTCATERIGFISYDHDS
jgi:hypothetical protein